MLGLAAAFLFALAAWLQQIAARTAVEGTPTTGADLPPVGRLMAMLLRSRVWLTGWLTNLFGFGTQAAALHLGSVAAVQPLMSTQLLFALPLSSLERHQWPALRDWLAALAVVGGLVLLFTAENAAPLEGSARRSLVLLATAAAAGLIMTLVAIGRRLPVRYASLLVAISAGICFALSAVFMKLTIDDLINRGVPATAVDWPGYALAGSTLSGLMLEQLAFASGPLPAAIAAMSVTNPVVSLTIGLLAFDVPAPTSPDALTRIAVAGALVTVGIIGLANSSCVTAMYRPSETDRKLPISNDLDRTAAPKNVTSDTRLYNKKLS